MTLQNNVQKSFWTSRRVLSTTEKVVILLFKMMIFKKWVNEEKSVTEIFLEFGFGDFAFKYCILEITFNLIE